MVVIFIFDGMKVKTNNFHCKHLELINQFVKHLVNKGS